MKLFDLAGKCSVSRPNALTSRFLNLLQKHGMSGRSLRRLPVLALAHSLGASHTANTPGSLGAGPFVMGATEVESWISGMDAIVDKHGDDVQKLI